MKEMRFSRNAAFLYKEKILCPRQMHCPTMPRAGPALNYREESWWLENLVRKDCGTTFCRWELEFSVKRINLERKRA